MVTNMYLITSYCFIDKKLPKTILFLHGWGCNLSYLMPLANLADYANSLIIDLPGFGDNLTFDVPKNIHDFVEIICNFIIENDFKIDYIVGHSFGGKLAVLLAKRLKINGLLLLAPSIYNSHRGLKYYLKVYTYKLLKKLNIFKNLWPLFGSKDYKALPPIMKKTMSYVINENIEKDLKELDIPIILFFGDKDQTTPKYIGRKIVKKAKDATLFLIPGDHFAYLNNLFYINLVLESLVINHA